MIKTVQNSTLCSLDEFMQKHKLPFGDKNLTHQWFSSDKNINFKVEPAEYDDFLKIYTKELEKQSVLHIMEKPLSTGPLYFDFDFKQHSSERAICTENITSIITIINDIITKYFVIDDKRKLVSFVFMKDKPFYDKKHNYFSDGFHIHYPNLVLDVNDRFLVFDLSKKEIQKRHILANMYEVLALNYPINTDVAHNETLYSRLSDEQKTDMNNKIFDPRIISVNKWFMYGSGKKKGQDYNIYQLENVYDSNVKEVDEEFSTEQLVKLFAIRKPMFSKPKYRVINIVSEEYDNLMANIKNIYSRKASVDSLFKMEDSTDQMLDAINNGVKEKLNGLKGTSTNTTHLLDATSTHGSLEEARAMIKLLNPNRAGPYDSWITVGWALYNISPKLYPEFLDFSKKDPVKYDESGCKKVWVDCSKRLDNSGYNIANLVKWAKEDNPELYSEILRGKINTILDNGDIRTDFDVACVIKEIYKYDFRCSSIKNNMWWHFNGNNWKRIEGGFELSLKLSTEVAFEFAKMHGDYMKLAVLETGSKADALKRKCKEIEGLIFNLKKSAYKERLIKECATLFYDKDFESKLDQNNYLVGFLNGVYDLKNGIFRKGTSDDMISKTTDYNFIDLDFESPDVKKVEEFIESIQPEKDMATYLMVFCASCFEGSNKNQKFMIWIGKGSNGKGSLIELLDNTLNGCSNGYFATLPPTILTQKRGSSSGATPELADKIGKRLIVLQETETDDKINVGFMKNITGQDKIETRPLYGDPFQYTPQFKLLLACNHLPNITSDEDGTWRRIRVIDFMISFKTNPTNKNERKADPELRDNLKYWKQAFAWLLLKKYYPIYKEHGLDKLEPERVKLSTDKYKADSNVFMEFFTEILEVAPESKTLLFSSDKLGQLDYSTSDIWGMFRNWHKNAYADRKVPSRKNIKEFFELSNYKITNSEEGFYVHGVREKSYSKIEIERTFEGTSTSKNIVLNL